MNKLRKELQVLLSETRSARPAALRRSLQPGFLYATDLPQAAEESEVISFCHRAESLGWYTKEENGWIQLDLSAEPEDTGFRGTAETEALACASLLQRHPGNRHDASAEIRILIKAAEEGSEAFEKACAALHREWAASLRKKEALPDLPESVFKGECEEC